MEKRHKSLLIKPRQERLEKPPAAKPSPSLWLAEDDPTPRVNLDYKKVPKQFIWETPKG